MKRYLIFASPVYYPTHAPEQVIGSADNEIEINSIIANMDDWLDYYSVLDLQDRVWIVDGDRNPNQK